MSDPTAKMGNNAFVDEMQTGILSHWLIKLNAPSQTKLASVQCGSTLGKQRVMKKLCLTP